MSKVVREDIGPLTANLNVQLEREDYEPKLKLELKKYQQQAHMKGFRKGKTPMSVIRKMYGKSVLAEVVNELLQKELSEYIQQEELNLLGQPIPAREQKPVDFDLQALDRYEFSFEIGLAPDLDVAGVAEDDVYEKYTVTVPDDAVEEELANARKRLGERIPSEGDIQLGDLLKLQAVELENNTPKEDGVQNEFSLLVESMTEDMQAAFQEKKVGERLIVDIFALEKDTEPNYVRKYFLGLEEDDERPVNETFELTIQEATRITAAELNESFFQQYFGEDTTITTEAEAREAIRKNIAAYYDKQAEALLFRDIQEALMEKNQPELPREFLKRWIMESNEKATEADVDQGFDRFADNLRWTLIRNSLSRRFDIQVDQEDIVEGFKDRVRNYLSNSPMADENFVNQMAMRLMQDQNQVEQVYEEMMTDKLYDALVEQVTVREKPIDLEAFLEIAKAAQEKAQAGTEEEE